MLGFAHAGHSKHGPAVNTRTKLGLFVLFYCLYLQQIIIIESIYCLTCWFILKQLDNFVVHEQIVYSLIYDSSSWYNITINLTLYSLPRYHTLILTRNVAWRRKRGRGTSSPEEQHVFVKRVRQAWQVTNDIHRAEINHVIIPLFTPRAFCSVSGAPPLYI